MTAHRGGRTEAGSTRSTAAPQSMARATTRAGRGANSCAALLRPPNLVYDEAEPIPPVEVAPPEEVGLPAEVAPPVEVAQQKEPLPIAPPASANAKSESVPVLSAMLDRVRPPGIGTPSRARI